jgi:proline iminopeptidase
MKKIITCISLLLYCSLLFANTEGTITNGNAKIFYRTFGKGNPILIINGGPGMNSDGFADLATALSKNNQAIIYDQRGTGKSSVASPDSTNITMQLMIDDIETLRKHLKIETWIVLGHSFGGMLASYYATMYPQHIESLILSSSGGIDLDLLNSVSSSINSKLTQAEHDSVEYWTQKINNGDTSYYARLQRGTYLAPAYLYNKKNVPVIARRLTQSNSQINGLVWDDMNRIKFDCAEKLATFNKPVLIIQGKQDVLDASIAQKAHDVFKNSNLVMLDNCAHYGWLDRPEMYFDVLNKFINSK